MRMLRWTAALIACLAVVSADAREPDDLVDLTVLATNDFHGAFQGLGAPELAGKGRLMGGVEYLGGMMAKLRAEAPGPVLMLDAGDCFQGELAVNVAEGLPCVRMFGLLGYDATTIGNHEFDYIDCGPEVERPVFPEAQPVGATAGDPRCALKKAMSAATYPVVVANVRDAATGDRWAMPAMRPWIVVEKGGIKVGITGVVTPTTPMVSNPGGSVGLKFTDPVAEVRDVLPAMREAGAGVIIVLAHLDGDCPRGDELATGRTSCRVGDDLGRLLDAFPDGEIDLVVAGHSHVFLAGNAQRPQVIESMSQGRTIARAVISVDRLTGRAAATRALPPVPICRAVDEASALCKPGYPGFQGIAPVLPAGRKLREEIEAVAAPICRDFVARAATVVAHVRDRESPLGDLTADMMRDAADDGKGGAGPADFAFVNMGSIRDSLAAGPITMCDLHRIWPFDDRLVEVSMTGAELDRILRFVTGTLHKWFAVSGLTIEVKKDGTLVALRDAAGKPVVADRRYRVVTSAYLLRGGDHIDTVVKDIPRDRFRVLSYPSQRDAFRAWMERRKTVEVPASGRIVISP